MRERTALVKQEPGSRAPAEPAAARWRRTRTLRVPTPIEPRAVEPLRSVVVARTARASGPRVRAIAAALLAGLAGLVAWRSLGSHDSFSERLSQGCEQLEPCRQLEAEAARREQSCWLGCGSELSDHRMARLLRYRAEERSAVREHYRQREDAERSEQQSEREQKLADWQREQAAHCKIISLSKVAKTVFGPSIVTAHVCASPVHAPSQPRKKLVPGWSAPTLSVTTVPAPKLAVHTPTQALIP